MTNNVFVMTHTQLVLLISIPIIFNGFFALILMWYFSVRLGDIDISEKFAAFLRKNDF